MRAAGRVFETPVLNNCETDRTGWSSGHECRADSAADGPGGNYCEQNVLLQQPEMHPEPEVDVKPETNLGIRIDQICRMLFPFNFILFNFLYWGYYLNY